MKTCPNTLILCGLIVTMSYGCAINRATAYKEPTAKLSTLKSMYVKQAPDDDTMYPLIADKLRSRGITVAIGKGPPPKDVDALVTYIDRWIWDITMYPVELTIVIREPQSEYPIALGNSYHTSLTRKSAKDMVAEVMDNIYK